MRPFHGIVILSLLLPAASAALEQTDDLAALGQQAEKEGKILVLMVSLSECHFCHLLRTEIFDPLLLGGEYQDDVLIREVSMDFAETLTDFDGSVQDAPDWADGQGISIAPVVLFLGSQGQNLAEPLVGVTTVDFYFHYLDIAVKSALTNPKRS